jgi:hypothetical protein
VQKICHSIKPNFFDHLISRNPDFNTSKLKLFKTSKQFLNHLSPNRNFKLFQKTVSPKLTYFKVFGSGSQSQTYSLKQYNMEKFDVKVGEREIGKIVLKVEALNQELDTAAKIWEILKKL